MGFFEELEDETWRKFNDVDYYERKEGGDKFNMNHLKQEIKQQETKIRNKQVKMQEFDAYNDDYEMYSLHPLRASYKFN